MKAKKLLLLSLLFITETLSAQNYQVPVSEQDEPMMQGKFQPTWESLANYKIPEWFRNVKFGIFGGGCTGEIISPEGLILTNHHCGYSSIQQHSSVEHDYLTDGFWATSRDQELPTPGLKFTFIERIEDITDVVNAKIAAKEITESQSFTTSSSEAHTSELQSH